ncbi:hypothetical protein FA95DRAFT_85971 [Auriscalpium vulgare]|uniref:Uncharacterized protein n=1 Tax=Auriscalpium vulgare TaxID=40419 RepID=A0ACB8RNY2_9AGAM|nr:hypothetical protein FA95DRAFT_85971 [Auriscalpium vulgare]
MWPDAAAMSESLHVDAPSHQLIEPVPRPLSPPASHEPPLKRRRVGFRQSSPPPPVQSPLTPPRSSADATVVGEPHVKQERTPSPVYVPEAKLTTSGTIRFDTLPLECQKSTLGYQAARNKWAEREARKVRARGLIVKRMFVREDGLVIDWESAKPVMSDTLEPDPADGNAVMERAYLANDAALKEVRRVKKMAQAGLQADAPMPPPALARAAEYDRRRSSEEAVELLTSMSPLAARSPTPDMPTPHSGLQPAESTTLAKCPLRSAEREPSSMRESILATPEKMSPGRLPQLMPSPPSPSLKVPEALAHARHSPGVGRDDVAPASPQRTPSRSMSRLLQPANPSTPGSATADLIHRRYVEAQLGSQAVRDDGDLAVEAADDLPGVTEAVDDAKVDIGMAGVVKVEVDDVVKVEADDVVKVEVDDVVKVEVDDVPEDDLYLDEGSLEYPEEVSFERYDADDETGIGAAVEVAMPSPEEVDRLADVAQLFLKNYIEAFDSEREGLSSAYSSDALFSCHWPPGTRRRACMH